MPWEPVAMGGSGRGRQRPGRAVVVVSVVVAGLAVLSVALLCFPDWSSTTTKPVPNSLPQTG